MPNDHASFCVIEGKSTLRIVPSRRRIWRTVALFFYSGAAAFIGGLCMDYWSENRQLGWWHEMRFFTIAGRLTAFLFWAYGIWTWLIRNRQLSVDLNTQEVAFGNRQLCGPGTVRSVELRYDPDPDTTEPYSIYFRLTDGMVANVPSPLFGGIKSFDEARNLAELLAAKLKVHVYSDA